MVKDRLSAEGIDSFVADENAGHLLAGLETALGGIRVLVAPEALQNARDVLANLSQPLGTSPGELSEQELATLSEEAAGSEGSVGTGEVPEPDETRTRGLRLLFVLLGAAALAIAVVWILVKARGQPPA
jgi:hypothetical protein